MTKQVISTTQAPSAIGAYSQAIRVGNTVYLSGQIALDPATGELVSDDVRAQIHQVFSNLATVARAAGLSLAHAVKVTVFMTDLAHFATVNEIMEEFFPEPFPARAAIGVAALPRGAAIEAEAILAD